MSILVSIPSLLLIAVNALLQWAQTGGRLEGWEPGLAGFGAYLLFGLVETVFFTLPLAVVDAAILRFVLPRIPERARRPATLILAGGAPIIGFGLVTGSFFTNDYGAGLPSILISALPWLWPYPVAAAFVGLPGRPLPLARTWAVPALMIPGAFQFVFPAFGAVAALGALILASKGRAAMAGLTLLGTFGLWSVVLFFDLMRPGVPNENYVAVGFGLACTAGGLALLAFAVLRGGASGRGPAAS